MKNIVIKIFISIFFSLFLMVFISCGDGGGGSNSASVPVVTPEGEKTYTVNPLPDALFYYWTESEQLYKCSENTVTAYTMTAIVSQDGKPDITVNIYPTEFYKLGYYYFFIFEFEGQEFLFRQLYDEIIEVDELMRHPDIYHQHMDNGRFSITTNTYEEYTVSDIRNITLSSGIVRTAMVQNYKIGEYNSWSYGLWFCAIDDNLSVTRSGLYYWPESYGSVIKIIDEKGEMW